MLRIGFEFRTKMPCVYVFQLKLEQGDKTVFDTSKLPAEECVTPLFIVMRSFYYSITLMFLFLLLLYVENRLSVLICRYALSLGLAGPPKMKLGEGKKKNISYAMQVFYWIQYLSLVVIT